MFKPKTYAHLCSAMQTGAVCQFDEKGPRMTNLIGVINGLKREDGSGYCWIVTVQPQGSGTSMADALIEPKDIFFRVES